MLKYLGIAMISACAFFIFFDYRGRLQKRLSELLELERLTRHLIHEISCFLRPLPECLLSFESNNEVIAEFVHIAAESGLNTALSELSSSLSLKPREYELLQSAFSGLGASYMKETVGHLESLRTELSEVISLAREESQKNIKIAATLSASISVGIMILLI